MRTRYAKPSRRLLQAAAELYRPIGWKMPIAAAISPKANTEQQQQLDLYRAERADTDLQKCEGPAVGEPLSPRMSFHPFQEQNNDPFNTATA